MAEAVAIVLWGVVELLLVLTGKVVVTGLSLGRWRAEDSGSQESRMWGPAGALSYRRDGQRVVTANGLLFAGLLFYVVATVTAFSLAAVLS